MEGRGRIVVVTESLGYGGTESHLLRTLPPLVDQGWQITVFCLSERGQRAGDAERGGVKVVSVSPLGEGRRSPRHLAAACAKLFSLARSWRPHISHFYLPAPYLIGTPIAMAARVPLKLMSRRSLADYQQRWPAAAKLERLAHGQMASIVGNCRAIVKELLEEGVPRQKIRLIYNGIDCPGLRVSRLEARASLGLDPEALIGIMVANLIDYKGHRDLIAGLALVADQLPKGWQFLFAGAGALRKELQAVSAANDLTSNIHFLGLRPDVAQLLAAADFGVLCPRGNEGFSNAILEGMAATLPMIVTDIGGNAEAVLDGETGFVVPAAQPTALGAAILRLTQNPQLRRRFGEAGRDRVRKHFSLERCTIAHAALYEEMLSTIHLHQFPWKASPAEEG